MDSSLDLALDLSRATGNPYQLIDSMIRHPFEIGPELYRQDGFFLFITKADLTEHFGMSPQLADFLSSAALCFRCGQSPKDFERHVACRPQKLRNPVDGAYADLELTLQAEKIEAYRQLRRKEARLRSAFSRAKRVRAASGSHSREQLQTLLELQEGRCFYCFAPLAGPDGRINGPGSLTTCHVEHYVALVHGGTNDISNIVLACPTCNATKRDMHGEDFIGECLNRVPRQTMKNLKRIHLARAAHELHLIE